MGVYQIRDRGWKKLLFRYRLDKYGNPMQFYATIRGAKKGIQNDKDYYNPYKIVHEE